MSLSEEPNRSCNAIIVGAGIGGLTAALTLEAVGIRSTIVESVETIRPLGVGINLQPAAVAELTRLDLGDALAATGIPIREMRYVDSHGSTLWAESRGIAAGHAHPQYAIHRGALQQLLLATVCERLGVDSLRTGVRVKSFEQGNDALRVHALDRRTGTPLQLEADLLVGADGLHSVIRPLAVPDEAPLSSAGVHMWRGTTEVDQFLDEHTMVIANDPEGSRLVAYPISADHAEKGTTLLNWVCLVPRPASGPIEDADWNRPGRLNEVLAYYKDWSLAWLDVRDTLTRGDGLLEYPMVDRDPLSTWGTGQVTLLGDAAHLMYPIGANGASQAILDATVLARELNTGDDVGQALRRYEAVRRPATEAIVRANRRMDSSERASASAVGNRSAAFAAMATDYRDTVNRANAGSCAPAAPLGAAPSR